jgi:ABC-type polysaccharide/polyol phosphate transport system ATPase subunit
MAAIPQLEVLRMSSEAAIRVSNLSKCYQIYDQPRDRLKQSLLPRLRRLIGLHPHHYYREFWALRDVSIAVGRGETVGIIGRNGSGKSTLLQMICGTLTPTGGRVETSGRVAALLELGAGFNPEFTGRENIYMNAAILGLRKSEIDSKYAQITAFADIGDFVEQPVKTYSSGMYVRLAFAVAIHVDPEILIIDEALAVGDIQFQMKCIARMEEIRARGTTILFVSHALEQVKRFCASAIWLENGVIRLAGEANYVTDQYRDTCLAALLPSPSSHDARQSAVQQGTPAVVKSVQVSAEQLAPFDALTVRVSYTIGGQALPKLLLGVAIRDAKGTYIFGPNTHLDQVCIPHSPGTHVVDYVIPRLPLLTGSYILDVGLFTDGGLVCLDYLGAAGRVCVTAGYFSEGLVYIDHEWRTITHG